MEPGTTIQPGGQQQPPQPLPSLDQQPQNSAYPYAAAQPAPMQSSPYELPNNRAVEQQPPIDGIQWTASEYIAHDKSAGWHVIVVVIGLAAAGLLYALTKDVISAITIGIVALLFSVAGARKPRVQQYAIGSFGVRIGRRTYGYDVIKSFSVVDDGPLRTIVLVPLKRFMPALSLYYPPEHEDEIAAELGEHLPFEVRQADPVDRLMRRLRF